MMTSVTRCWNEKVAQFPPKVAKLVHTGGLTLKVPFSKSLKSCITIGQLLQKYHDQDLSKIAQSGHTNDDD